MSESRSKTRELLEQLASTEYRRSARADQIFRSLRDEPRPTTDGTKGKTSPTEDPGSGR